MTKTKNAREISVCVLGAGVCGLTSLKACLDSGFQVTCFDKSPTYGGLWQYHSDLERDAKGQFIPSVMRTTILNTSKELSAFSDFPPPAKLPNFMKHNLYMDYIRSYVDNFKLLPHIRLQHEILRCEPQLDSETGAIRWAVEVRDLNEGGRSCTRYFDRLMIATGHHNIPFVPTFPDQHKFKGQIVHSAQVKDILTDQRFVDKRVVVIGFGNSACDAANDIAMVASKCYVSCHRGNWFIGRLAPKGLYDFEVHNRWNHYRCELLPAEVVDRLKIKKVEQRLNHQLLGLRPKHKPSEHVPAINDLFPYRIFTGGVTLKSSLARFTQSGVVFQGEENEEHQVDLVVLATGYQAQVNFLDELQLGLKSPECRDEYELYLNMFAPRLSVPGVDSSLASEAIRSLAFIGLVQPAGSITVISELQARLAALVFEGKRDLPSAEKMIDHIRAARAKRSSAIRSHSRDQFVGHWIAYSDSVAKLIGSKPNMSRLFFKDFALWKQLMFGPSVSYQYRLAGPGNWSKARETIMAVNDRVYQGINEGKNHVLFQSRIKSLRERESKIV